MIKGEYDKGAKEFKEALALAGKDDQAQALHRAYAKDGLRGLLKAQIKLWSHPEKPDDYDPEINVAKEYADMQEQDIADCFDSEGYETE